MMALSTGVTRRMAFEACDRAGDCQRLGNGARQRAEQRAEQRRPGQRRSGLQVGIYLVFVERAMTVHRSRAEW